MVNGGGQHLPKIALDLCNGLRQRYAGPVFDGKGFIWAAEFLVMPSTCGGKLTHCCITTPSDPGPLPDQFVVPQGELIFIGPVLAKQPEQLVPLLHDAVVPL